MSTIDAIATPAVMVNRQVLENNIRRMSELCRTHGIALRPHIKSHNVPQIARLQLAAGASGLTVATLREAVNMVRQGIRDLFIAREMADAVNVKRLSQLAREADIILAVDSTEGVDRLGKMMRSEGARVKVLIEVDVGGHRCGIESADAVCRLAGHLRNCDALIFQGIFTHEGHVYSASTPEEMKAIAAGAIDRMGRTARALSQAGNQAAVVSIGSSPAVKNVNAFPGITEVRPGNYVFNDGMQVANGSATLADCALTVAATVISKPTDRRAVLNVGTKLLGSDTGRNISDVQGYGLITEPQRYIISRVYEEHALIEVPNPFKVGDRVTFIPSHACMAANLARTLYLVEGKDREIIEEWHNG